MNREAENLEQQLEARDPDVRLMVEVRADVPGAFESLVERYQNRLVGIFFHMVGNIDEAEMGSLTLRQTSSPHRGSANQLPAAPPSRLHGERAIAMVSTFQLTRSTRLSLAHRNTRKEEAKR